MTVVVQRSPWPLFLALAALIVCGSMAVASSASFALNPTILSLAVAADLIIVAPLIYWRLIVRRRAAAARTLIPIIVLGVVAVNAVLPASHSGFLGWVRYLVMPAEIGLVVYIALKLRALLRGRSRTESPDLADSIEHVLEHAVGQRAVARFVAAELTVMYYALAGRRRHANAAASAAAEFYVARSGMVLTVLGAVLAIETVGLHLLVMRWSPVAAWILTGLSAYTLLWFIGDFRALALRPTRLSPDTLRLRVGLRFAADVPLECVERIEPAGWRDAHRRTPGVINLATPATPNVLVMFREPVIARRYFGIEQQVRGVMLEMRDTAGFMNALRPPLECRTKKG